MYIYIIYYKYNCNVILAFFDLYKKTLKYLNLLLTSEETKYKRG